jgi:hypothetical protein
VLPSVSRKPRSSAVAASDRPTRWNVSAIAAATEAASRMPPSTIGRAYQPAGISSIAPRGARGLARLRRSWRRRRGGRGRPRRRAPPGWQPRDDQAGPRRSSEREGRARPLRRAVRKSGSGPGGATSARRSARHPALTMLAQVSLGFYKRSAGEKAFVIVAASTIAVVAIAAAVIVVALLAWYVLPRGGRRKRPPRR